MKNFAPYLQKIALNYQASCSVFSILQGVKCPIYSYIVLYLKDSPIYSYIFLYLEDSPIYFRVSKKC